MRLNAPKGQKVKFTAIGGHETEVVSAQQNLQLFGEYTVDDVRVGSTMSYVYLREFPDLCFNTSMFEESGDILEPTETIEERYNRQYAGVV